MELSYQGIGAWCATLAGSDLAEGKVVKMSGNGTVAACSAGDAFCGVVAAGARDKTACSVQLAGLATVSYSGTAPSVGYCELVANANGGVALAGNDQTGRKLLVLNVDTTASTIVIQL